MTDNTNVTVLICIHNTVYWNVHRVKRHFTSCVCYGGIQSCKTQTIYLKCYTDCVFSSWLRGCTQLLLSGHMHTWRPLFTHQRRLFWAVPVTLFTFFFYQYQYLFSAFIFFPWIPWMSSLNVQYLLRYLLSSRKALTFAKSSNWIRQSIPYLWREEWQQRPLIDWINHHPMGDISDTRWRGAACAFKDYSSPEGGAVLLHYTAQRERWEEMLQLLNAQSLHNRTNSLFWMCLVTRTSFKLHKNTNLSNPHSRTYKIHRALATVVFYRHLMSWHLFDSTSQWASTREVKPPQSSIFTKNRTFKKKRAQSPPSVPVNQQSSTLQDATQTTYHM